MIWNRDMETAPRAALRARQAEGKAVRVVERR